MNNLRLNKLIIIGLIFSNLLLLFILYNRTKLFVFDPDIPRNTVIQRLNFSKEQIKKYDVLIHDHRSQIKSKNNQIIILKNKLYTQLNSNQESDSIQDSLLYELGVLQQEIELIHFNHFKDIKKLCTEDQLADYNQLIEDITDIFTPHLKRQK